MTHDSVEYVRTLLVDMPTGSIEHEIGRHVWELSDNEDVLVYLTELMTVNAPNTRAFEIAWDIWVLMAKVAA